MSADRKYLINAQMLGGIEIGGTNGEYIQVTATDAIGNVDTALSGGINGANLISAINSAYAAASGNEPGAPAASVQFNNGSGGFGGSEYWLVSELNDGAVSTISGSFSLTGSNSSLSVSGPSAFTGASSFAAGATVASGEGITGRGVMSVATATGDLSLSSGDAEVVVQLSDDGGVRKLEIKDSTSAVVSSIDSDGNLIAVGGDFGGAVDSAGDFSVATNKLTVASATGNTAVAGTLGVTGVATFTDAIDANSTSDFQGAMNLQSTLAVADKLSGEEAQFSALVAMDAAATVGTTLSVGGVSTFTGAIDANSTSDFQGAMNLQSTLAVADKLSGEEAQFTALVAMDAAATVGTTLSVGGVSTFTGAIDANSTSDFQGAMNLQSTLAVADKLSGEEAQFSALVAMDAAATVGTTLGVTGVATFTAQSVHSAGANMSSNGIINAGAIAGATTVAASGLISTTSASGISIGGTNSAGAPADYAFTVVGGVLVINETVR